MPKNRLPVWMRRPLPSCKAICKTKKILSCGKLKTVCEEAMCPNMPECFSKSTATFLAMGKECTRSCSFCNIKHNKDPLPLDPKEPQKIALAAKELQLKHVVVTMVTRDDIGDGGAKHLASIIYEIRNSCNASIEVLTSDFNGDKHSVKKILEAKPDIFNHNIETVERLSEKVRHVASYKRSLEILRYAKTFGLPVKSGLMVGLGESEEEVKQALNDLSFCDIVTIGQYLQPSKFQRSVVEFIEPEKFKRYENYGFKVGIKKMLCGPFVRSSYNASNFH